MRLRQAGRIARRELRGGLGAFRIFLTCLTLGVMAIAAVGTVRISIEDGLGREGAVILGGDAEMEFTYRFASESEQDWMRSVSDRMSEIVDFRSMAVNGAGERGLTQVKAVDTMYPLLGSVGLEPEMSLHDALKGDGTRPGAVMQKVLIDRLGLKIGDTVRLGSKDFVLAAELAREPDAGTAGFSLGPRTIVFTRDLQGSGLLSEGSLFDTDYRLDLPDTAVLDQVKAEAQARFQDEGMRWRDARNGAPGIQRFVDRIGAFLVLVGLAGLAVGGVGISASVRAYLSAKTGTIATLRTLGADRTTIFLTYLIQIGVLTAIGVVLGVALGAALPLALGPVIEARLPVPIALGIKWTALAEAAVYGLLTALIFALWPLARTEEVRAAALFRDGTSLAPRLPRGRYLIAIGLLLALLVGLAAALSGVPHLALWAAAGVAAALAVLVIAAYGLRRLAAWAAKKGVARGRPALRWAVAAIGGPREETTSVVLSLGLGLAVLAAVGQIDRNLRNAIQDDLPERAPSYFFVDIQPGQLQGFLDRVENDPAVSRVDTAPNLRGVITKINGRPAREVAGNHWVVRGDRGLTYSATKPDNVTMAEGEWWPEDYDGPPLVSFAQEEAQEIGVKIGDTITMNILGREITATISSLRVVDFSNAGIGFVLSMNPSALAGAPHTHIATVYADESAEAAILRDIANAYPNVTAIRVRDAIDNVTRVLSGIAAATSWAAGATLLTGFVVLIGAAAAGERARVQEAAILKVLGATRPRILASFALRSALLGAAAGLVALAAGIAAGWGVMVFVMETDFAVNWGSGIAIIAGGIVAVLLSGLAFAWRPLTARPARVLRAAD
ncbi:ABC transporter permease [Mangrovicoccus sp. HB161399]|uniref:ABC transporter permease n=1 Tax=Mangrovicoccus sp. HB161399 TaxID=2720392 RepID=UPI0015529059|nr:FtsX-like permease family protein [Mangrovicoccus sp. HB161399]